MQVSKFLHHVGGVETYFSGVTRDLLVRGHEVQVVGMAPPVGRRVMDFGTAPVIQTPNRDFRGGTGERIWSGLNSVYSLSTASKIRQALESFKPEIVHFHGTCYQLTPSVVREVAKLQLPIILTAHEYKLVCANQTMWNDTEEEVCKLCLGRPSIARAENILSTRCIKGSHVASLAGAVEQIVASRVWAGANPMIHCPSRFMKRTLIEHGFASERLFYLDLPWADSTGSGASPPGPPTVLFIGRLAVEKGVEDLIAAWRFVISDHPDARLRIVGSGAQDELVRERAASTGLENIEVLGAVPHEKVKELLQLASVTVHPSRWEENSPYSVRESLRAGVPAVVSRVGGMPEMVNAASGQIFAARNIGELASSISTELSLQRARSRSFETAVEQRAVTSEQHMRALLEVYRHEVERARLQVRGH